MWLFPWRGSQQIRMSKEKSICKNNALWISYIYLYAKHLCFLIFSLNCNMWISVSEIANTGNRKKKTSFADEASAQYLNASIDSNPHQVFLKLPTQFPLCFVASWCFYFVCWKLTSNINSKRLLKVLEGRNAKKQCQDLKGLVYIQTYLLECPY